jgi:hypothetical protein
MQIAAELDVRPAAIMPIVRKLATEIRENTSPADRALLGCWINPGWSAGLGLDDAPPEWAASDATDGPFRASSGLVGIVVARQERPSRATVCGYLVDVYCLGVKNTTGPKVISAGSVNAYGRIFMDAFDELPIPIPIDLAQHLVRGAVDFAANLGFAPHPDFADIGPYLGTAPAPNPIRFGKDGKPFFIAGPDDDSGAVIAALEASVGNGNYEFIASI